MDAGRHGGGSKEIEGSSCNALSNSRQILIRKRRVKWRKVRQHFPCTLKHILNSRPFKKRIRKLNTTKKIDENLLL